MSIDDEPVSHPAPRFVPTLTEVVGPGDAVAPPPVELQPESAPPCESKEDAVAPALTPAPALLSASDLDRVAEMLLARLAPELDRLIPDAIGRVVHEQMLGFSARVQKTVGELVREELAKAFAKGDHD